MVIFTPRLKISEIFLVLIMVLCLLSCDNDKSKSLQVGDLAPDFAKEDISNVLISTKKATGKPMVLRFFDPDCKYCKADTVVFNNFYKKYRDQGLQVVYFDTEKDPSNINKFVDELKIEFPVVLDSKREIASEYRVKVVPQTIILAPDHKIIGAILGGVSEAQLEELLLKYLH